MRKKGVLDNRLVYFLVIVSLIVLSIVGVVVVKKFLALATYIPGEAGYITEVEIQMQYNATDWAGAWGFAIWIPGYGGITPSITLQGDSVEQINNLFFDCIDKDGGEIYASTSQNIDWDTVTNASTSQVDDFLNVSESYPLSGTRTFTQTINVKLGNNNISNVPAIYTFQAGNESSTRFDVGVLTDGNGNIIFVTNNILPNTPDTLYSNESEVYGNYQTMLPIP